MTNNQNQPAETTDTQEVQQQESCMANSVTLGYGFAVGMLMFNGALLALDIFVQASGYEILGDNATSADGDFVG